MTWYSPPEWLPHQMLNLQNTRHQQHYRHIHSWIVHPPIHQRRLRTLSLSQAQELASNLLKQIFHWQVEQWIDPHFDEWNRGNIVSTPRHHLRGTYLG